MHNSCRNQAGSEELSLQIEENVSFFQQETSCKELVMTRAGPCWLCSGFGEMSEDIFPKTWIWPNWKRPSANAFFALIFKDKTIWKAISFAVSDSFTLDTSQGACWMRAVYRSGF